MAGLANQKRHFEIGLRLPIGQNAADVATHAAAIVDQVPSVDGYAHYVARCGVKISARIVYELKSPWVTIDANALFVR